MQGIAQDCLEVLCTAADALKQWSVDVSRHVQQQTLADSRQQPGHPTKSAAELHMTVVWLLQLATDLLHAMRRQELCSDVDQRLLLNTLGQLVRRVRCCLSFESRMSAAVLSCTKRC